jgi:hypothetical protein
MLHRREHLAERIANLCQGRDLPVEVLAADTYVKGIHLGLRRGIDLHVNHRAKKHEFDTVKPEVLRCVHKLQEMWDGICQLVEKANFKLLEARGSDPTNKFVHVGANTMEIEKAKVRKCDGCRDRRMHELPLHIAIGNRERKADL